MEHLGKGDLDGPIVAQNVEPQEVGPINSFDQALDFSGVLGGDGTVGDLTGIA
jgi:hypothetical protein